VVSLIATTAGCAQTAPRVRPGIDVLLTDSTALIAGKRVGLITNQTGVDAHGVSTIDRLFAASSDPRSRFPVPRLVALFAPEHGIRGAAAPGERISDTSDAATGLPIYSLYGANRSPTPVQMADVDVLIVDLQDVGVRTYTYISTIILAMRSARAAGKPIVILDRPNPIGCAVSGPVLDTANASFIGMLPVPLRHGLTMGEMARFANTELGIGADLVVVPVQGWIRCSWFEETGLPWVAPSPNLPTMESLEWYPGTVLFEATNLSVGRGTDAPFRQVGAPWLEPDTTTLAASNAAPVRPVTFTPRQPGDGKFAGVAVRGYRFRAGKQFRTRDAVADALRLMTDIARRYPDSLTVDSVGLARRLGVPFNVRFPPPEPGGIPLDIQTFRRRAEPYLLYR